MKKLIAFAASLVFVGLACGGSSPQDECDKEASAFCNKLYQCVDPATIKTTLGYASESDCEATERTAFKCTNATANCPAGTTFDGSRADQCISDYSNLACNQIATVPASCNANVICH